MRVLVTGATGYIGGRLVPRLLAAGHQVRCLARDPSRLAGRRWEGVEVVGGDLADASAVTRAMEGVDAAYFLVHSMASVRAFPARDRVLAELFGRKAANAGVRRIVYLGGLGDPCEVHSAHLRSRQEVGRVLADSGVPTVELRAAVIVGSGSVSFEMLRALTERLPVMVTPRWVDTRCQPIGVRDVLDYLVAALDHPTAQGIYEIGGSDVLSYRQMMLTYGRLHGLRRVIIPLRVPFPQLSSLFVGLVTPIPYRFARPLVDSLCTEVVVRDDRARREFGLRPAGYAESVQRALTRMAADEVETTWSSSLTSGGEEPGRHLTAHEGMLLDHHRTIVDAPSDAVFAEVCALGGDAGWPAGNLLWQVRGMIDRVAGGTGMRRGRRHPRELRVGDPVDFWRVEALEPQRLLRLRAEMKVPGAAWLQFEVHPDGARTIVDQTAYYDPRGVAGYAYWYAVLPFHRFIFPGMLAEVCRRAEQRVAGDATSTVAA